MPEFVTCPVCGCKVQMPESMLGRRVRCFGCDQRFVATPESASAPRPDQAPQPRPSAADDRPAPLPPPRAADDEASHGGPYCPGCGRRVPWQGRYCPYCGEEFDDADVVRASRGRYRFRRDTVPHRGGLLTTLGNISLAAGALSLCLFGAGAIIGVPLGIAVWVMAQTDLAQMREGIMDSQGRHLTETARASAITGVVLSLLFAAGYGAMFLTTL